MDLQAGAGEPHVSGPTHHLDQGGTSQQPSHLPLMRLRYLHMVVPCMTGPC